MRPTLKNYLGFGGVLALAAFSFAAIFGVLAYAEANKPVTGNFSVSAEGEAVATPDIAEFTFGVLTQGGTNLAKTQLENTDKANAAVSFLKSQGIDAKDIKTQRYGVEPRYQYFACPSSSQRSTTCPPPEIVGYSVSQTVLVEMRDFSKIGETLAGVVEKGANTVSQLSFTIDDPAELENKARTEAVEKARQKAEALAKTGRFRLGKLLAVEEDGAGPQPFALKALSEAGGFGGDAAPAIEPGSEKVTVTVRLTYEIK